ncbi:hypothetical protein HMPREF1417_00282 [Helicobacter pylori GAM260Bi]|nr:hypothetical protein HMPREF1417_00282 [Helicobacter pylori GAM260Bi]EMH70830.1 hypothetical protein HMPREF1452_00770 [Helicobacter pylori HP260Bi]
MKEVKRAFIVFILLFFKRGFKMKKRLMERLNKSVIMCYLNFKE